MNGKYSQYYSNIQMINRLVRPKFPADMSKAEILSAIRSGADQIASLKAWNDSFLNEFIYHRHPEDISPEEKGELLELADALFQNGRGVDVGMAYRIHGLLDACAIAHQDTDLHIRELYYQGLALNFFHMYRPKLGINLRGETIHRYFCEGASYLKDYEKFSSEETRAYILRCLGNRKYGSPAIKGDNNWRHPPEVAFGYARYMKIFNEAMAVFTSEKYQKMNPGLPWDTYIYSMHFDRIVYLQVAREKKFRQKEPVLYKKIVQGILESAEYVYRHQEQIAKLKHQTVGARTQYFYASARYHAGQLSEMELLDIILSCVEHADESDYSANGTVGNISLSVYAKFYFDQASEETRRLIQPRIQAVLDRVIRYLVNYPSDSSIDPWLAIMLSELIQERFTQEKGYRESMMNYLLLCHAPTCVHSRVVAILAKAMMERLIRVSPEALVGVLDTKNVEEVRRRSDELALRAYRCGLYHDIGKSAVINYITIYGRRLLDEEYEAIQYHPVMGLDILNCFDDLLVESEIALRHHLFYNGQGGYPHDCPPCPPAVKKLVDLVSVADSMDAATDNIGRSYAASKSFSALLEELRAGSGTRYSPDVVALFDNSDFSAELERTLTSNRQEIYYSVYRSIDGQNSARLIPTIAGTMKV